MKYTAIIILNYNNSYDTINCIETIHKYNTAPIKIIIVDNGSSQNKEICEIEDYLLIIHYPNVCILNEKDDFPETYPYITFYKTEKNDGFARGNNKGLNLIKNENGIECILILNNDVLFTCDVIPTLINDIDTLPDAGIVSPLLMKKDCINIDLNCARKQESRLYLLLLHLFCYKDLFGILNVMRKRQYLLTEKIVSEKRIVDIELPSGSCMLIRKDLFEKIGFFDPNTFLYYEENILYSKIKNLGLKNYLDTAISCIHLGASTTRKQKTNLFLIKSGITSKNYYLKNYTNVGFLYLTILILLEKFSVMMLKIKTMLKK